jgi:rare lipoprotein A (peptidoglycan hydrolase)
VAVYFAGKAITVPVVDRGPFANGARYDLTSAVAKAVGMNETSMIGVVPQRGSQMAPPPPLAPSPYAGTGGASPTP